MILKQFYLNCLAHASYLIGDEHTHAAAVVDPQRDVDQYLAFATEHGLRIQHVFLLTSTPTSSPATSSCVTVPARRSIWERPREPSIHSSLSTKAISSTWAECG